MGTLCCEVAANVLPPHIIFLKILKPGPVTKCTCKLLLIDKHFIVCLHNLLQMGSYRKASQDYFVSDTSVSGNLFLLTIETRSSPTSDGPRDALC